MCKSQIIESLLKKIFQTVERILANSETITSPFFLFIDSIRNGKTREYLYVINSHR